MSDETISAEAVKRLHKHLLDSGRLIEAGWQGLRIIAVNPNAPQVQLDCMREAFFAGAQHLFAALMMALDPDAEATVDDLRRLDLINTELQEFIAEFEVRHNLKRTDVQ